MADDRTGGQAYRAIAEALEPTLRMSVRRYDDPLVPESLRWRTVDGFVHFYGRGERGTRYEIPVSHADLPGDPRLRDFIFNRSD